LETDERIQYNSSKHLQVDEHLAAQLRKIDEIETMIANCQYPGSQIDLETDLEIQKLNT